MRHAAVFLCLTVLAIPTFAQDVPRVELFGGYSYLHVDTQGNTSASLTQLCNTASGGNCPFVFQVHPGMNGWVAAGQINVNSWLGFKADFSGNYGTLVKASFANTTTTVDITPNQSNYDFLFGPVFSYRKYRYTPFFHTLFGDEHVSLVRLQIAGIGPAFASSSSDSFALALGGGLDLKVARRILLRVGEFDYQFVNGNGIFPGHQNDYRFSTGVVFLFPHK